MLISWTTPSYIETWRRRPGAAEPAVLVTLHLSGERSSGDFQKYCHAYGVSFGRGSFA